MTITFMWQPLAYMRRRFRREQTDYCRAWRRIHHRLACHSLPGPTDGIHWLFGFVAAIVLIAAIMLFDRQFEDDGAALPATGGAFAQIAVWLVIALTAANVVTTLMECGFGPATTTPSSTNCSSAPPS